MERVPRGLGGGQGRSVVGGGPRHGRAPKASVPASALLLLVKKTVLHQLRWSTRGSAVSLKCTEIQNVTIMTITTTHQQKRMLAQMIDDDDNDDDNDDDDDDDEDEDGDDD